MIQTSRACESVEVTNFGAFEKGVSSWWTQEKAKQASALNFQYRICHDWKKNCEMNADNEDKKMKSS